MSSFDMSLADWPYAWAIFYASTLLIIGLATFTPAAYDVCDNAGFNQPRDKPLNVYVYLLAGCQLMIGLSISILIWAGEWRAVSVIVSCAMPMGIIGTTLSVRTGGFGSAFWSHAILLAIGSSAGVRLLQNHW